jgi:hypothetical protein
MFTFSEKNGIIISHEIKKWKAASYCLLNPKVFRVMGLVYYILDTTGGTDGKKENSAGYWR